MSNENLSEPSSELRKLVELAYLVVIFSACAWAKEFVLPLILAILISFLLAPVVSRLQRWRFPHAVAVLGVVGVAFAVLGAIGSTLSIEGLDLINSLPKYRENIQARWEAIEKGPPGPLNLAFNNLGEAINDFSKFTASAGGAQKAETTRVEVVSGADNILTMVKNSLTPVMGPLAEFALVVVLVVFMLLERKRLRSRFLRLIGHSRVATTTLAVDEAGSRLSAFLFGQLMVNTGYALVLGIGLFLIGIPNALLWASLTLVLRFLPYIGLWISAFFPLVLSVAISTTWKEPTLTLALYGFLEVFTNNVVEPFVLGGSTGMSPLAVIVSALFWTWLWGPIGLFLATPLTACLVVLGRYFPAFHIYSVLLAAEPPTSSETRLIRLLVEGRLPEARALLQKLGNMRLSPAIAEELILPTLRAIENDLFPGSVNQTKSRIYAQLRELIEEMTVEPPLEADREIPLVPSETPVLSIVPCIGEADEIVGRVICRLLAAEGINADLLSWRTLRTEKVQHLRETKAQFILLSALEIRSGLAVGKMAQSIKVAVPDGTILVGLWSLPAEGAARWIKKIKESSGGAVYNNLDYAIRAIVPLIPRANGKTIEASAETAELIVNS